MLTLLQVPVGIFRIRVGDFLSLPAIVGRVLG